MENKERIVDCDFRVRKNFEELKKNKVYKCYGGLVSGVSMKSGKCIPFTDKTIFKAINFVTFEQAIENRKELIKDINKYRGR